MPGDDVVVRDLERWFISRGTPHLINDYSASRDIFTRALPMLTLVFLVEVAGALNADWSWWQNALATVGGIVLLLGIWAGVNLLRNRPAFGRPASVGPIELAVFVLGPTLVPIVFGGQGGQAALVIAVNLAILATIYVATSYGVVPLTRWALGRTVTELGAVVGLLARALPLLLVVVVFLFFTAELWQVMGPLEGQALAGGLGLFVVIGVVFLLTRLPAELGALARFDDADELARCCADTPAATLAVDAAGALDDKPLGRRQRGNLILVVLVSEGVQVVLVTITLALFFVLFGLITIRPDTIGSFTQRGTVDVLWDFTLLNHDVVVTAELVKVSSFLAVFAGFSFTLSVVTDAAYREEFFNRIVSEVRQTLAARAVYLTLV